VHKGWGLLGKNNGPYQKKTRRQKWKNEKLFSKELIEKKRDQGKGEEVMKKWERGENQDERSGRKFSYEAGKYKKEKRQIKRDRSKGGERKADPRRSDGKYKKKKSMDPTKGDKVHALWEV